MSDWLSVGKIESVEIKKQSFIEMETRKNSSIICTSARNMKNFFTVSYIHSN